jgi:hypothetical protein
MPSWKYRRRAIFSTLYFGAIIIAWITFSGDDRAVLETVVLSIAGLMGAALSVYTGAAAWEDVRTREVKQRPAVSGYSDGNDDDHGGKYGYRDEHH